MNLKGQDPLLSKRCEMARIVLLEEAEEERLRKNLILRKRQLREDINPMLLPDSTFIEIFCLSKNKFSQLCEDVIPLLPSSQRTTAIRPEIKILAALQFYATGSYQKRVGSDFSLGLSQTSVSDCLTEVTDVLNQPQILRKYITFSKTSDEHLAVQRRFKDQCGFPGVLGCIGCTQVAIIRPSEHQELYFNRKMYHSLNVLLICDADLQILHVDASFGGSVHDSHVWNLCSVKSGIQRLHEIGQTYWFLGDTAYAQKPWMMTPIPNAQPESAAEHYNNKLVCTRNVLDKCVGVLKSRFRCLLAHKAMHYTPEKAGKIVNACVVLHNFICEPRWRIDEEAMRLDFERQPPVSMFRSLDKVQRQGPCGV